MVANEGSKLAGKSTKIPDKSIEGLKTSKLALIGEAKEAFLVEDQEVVHSPPQTLITKQFLFHYLQASKSNLP